MRHWPLVTLKYGYGHNSIGIRELTRTSYFQRCRFCPVQATIRTLRATSSAASNSGVSKHTDSSVISDPDHTLDSSPSSGAMTNMSDRDRRPWTSHLLIRTGPMGWFSEPRPMGFSKHRFDSMFLIYKYKKNTAQIFERSFAFRLYKLPGVIKWKYTEILDWSLWVVL